MKHVPAHIALFCESLGWRHVRRFEHVVPAGGRRSSSQTIVWYESGKLDTICLQLNALPPYDTCVLAIRYRLCSGWHRARLSHRVSDIRREAARLEPWLHRRWFTTLDRRRAYRIAHPECTGWSWKRIRAEGYLRFDGVE